MRRLLLSLLALALLLFAIDRNVGRVLAARYRSSPGGEAGAIERGLASRSPVLICGSSRALHHYDAEALGKRLGLGVWNLGLDGQWGPYYPYGVAMIALKRGDPRLWILEVDERLSSGPDQMATLNVLLPYANENPAVAELVNRRSRYERLKRLSAIYPYNSLALALSGWHGNDPSRRGFVPLSGRLSAADKAGSLEGVAPGDSAEPSINVSKLRYARAMVDSLTRHGTAVLAFRSPEYMRGAWDRARASAESARLRQALRAIGVRFFDLDDGSRHDFDDPALFQDRTHLNIRGAERYTDLVADSILAQGLPGLEGPVPGGQGPHNELPK